MDLYEQARRAEERARLYGVYPAIVVDNRDPDGQGRVKVSLPWMPDDSGGYKVWARVATLMAGKDRGTWFIPDVDDEVLIAFEMGDPRRPYIIGAMWNGQDTPPESMDGAGNNFVKSITSRNGVTITLDDQDGQEKLILETPGGQKITLQDGPGRVEIKDSNGNSVTLQSSGVSVVAAAKVSVQASTVEVNAALVTVNAAMSKFSGVVQCDTLISNMVVSAAYTPGAGNIW
jgi:uncharacterized protein involved in type VI secretion and phage assembly